MHSLWKSCAPIWPVIQLKVVHKMCQGGWASPQGGGHPQSQLYGQLVTTGADRVGGCDASPMNSLFWSWACMSLRKVVTGDSSLSGWGSVFERKAFLSRQHKLSGAVSTVSNAETFSAIHPGTSHGGKDGQRWFLFFCRCDEAQIKVYWLTMRWQRPISGRSVLSTVLHFSIRTDIIEHRGPWERSMFPLARVCVQNSLLSWGKFSVYPVFLGWMLLHMGGRFPTGLDSPDLESAESCVIKPHAPH